MQHIHLDRINSTQDYLKKLLQQRLGDQNSNILITTDQQTQGVGRRERTWLDHPQCLTISFTITPNPVITLTTLEVSVLIARFFKENFNLKIGLKWPNDLYYANKKVGGCLIDQMQNFMLVGIGINLGHSEALSSEFSHLSLAITDKVELAKSLYQFILVHRMSELDVRNEWISDCVHIAETVTCQDGEQILEGEFVGIGPYGEALVQVEQKIVKLYSATIRF